MSIVSKAEVTLQSTLFSNSEWEIVYPIDDRIVHRWKFSSSELGVSAIFKGRKSHELKYSYYLSKSNTETFDSSNLVSILLGVIYTSITKSTKQCQSGKLSHLTIATIF